jgi:BirA family biotin operon repressor/biotin-[acetyl-CoA-carboxylase] ligase
MCRITNDERRLKACAEKRALPLGDVFCFERLGSTMDDAHRLGAEGARHFSVVMSREQMRGRGRFGRPWYSVDGSLYASLILREFDSRIPYSLVASLAVHRVLRGLHLDVSLKWVNDVLCPGGRKIAGVLTEEKEGCSVIGMGLNVNVNRFPPELEGTATSYRCETGKTMEVLDMLCLLLGELVPLIEAAHRGQIESLLEEWEDTAAMRGRTARLEGDFGTVRGVIAGINRRSGALLLSTDGNIREYYGGSLIFEA